MSDKNYADYEIIIKQDGKEIKKIDNIYSLLLCCMSNFKENDDCDEFDFDCDFCGNSDFLQLIEKYADFSVAKFIFERDIDFD